MKINVKECLALLGAAIVLRVVLIVIIGSEDPTFSDTHLRVGNFRKASQILEESLPDEIPEEDEVTSTKKSDDQWPFEITFLQKAEYVCRRLDSTIRIRNAAIIVVHSGRYNFQARYAIRRTFGTVRRFNAVGFGLVFMLGLPGPNFDNQFEFLLSKELEVYQDIVVGNFTDTFQNLTYKHLAGLKWAAEFCKTADFYIKTDDDYLLNIFRISRLISSIQGGDYNYYCMASSDWSPETDPRNKYQISEKEFPDDEYPEICTGLYIIRMQAVNSLNSIAKTVKYFPLEDVFVTGLLRETWNHHHVDRDIWRIGIVPGLVLNHTVTERREINAQLINPKYMEIYTRGRLTRACNLWIEVLKVHKLTGKIKVHCIGTMPRNVTSDLEKVI